MPATTVELVPTRDTTTPVEALPLLPVMTFRSPASFTPSPSVPTRVLVAAKFTSTPLPTLARREFPSGVVPMKLPATTVPIAAATQTPCSPLPPTVFPSTTVRTAPWPATPQLPTITPL